MSVAWQQQLDQLQRDLEADRRRAEAWQREVDLRADQEALRRHEQLERQRDLEEAERRRQAEGQPDRQGGRQADSGRTDLQLDSHRQLERDPQREIQVAARLQELQAESDRLRDLQAEADRQRELQISARLGELQAETDRQQQLSVPGVYANTETAEEQERGYRVAEFEKALSHAVQAAYGTDGPWARWVYMQEQYQAPRSRTAEPNPTLRVSAPESGVAPPFAIGEIKKLNELEIVRGLRQLGRREHEFLMKVGAAQEVNPWLAAQNLGLVTYAVSGEIAEVYLQVFGPRTSPMRSIIWEGKIGVVPVPSRLPPTELGNYLEAPIRALASHATGQFFPAKHASAGGPDLVARPRGVYPGMLPLRINLMPPVPPKPVPRTRINLRPRK